MVKVQVKLAKGLEEIEAELQDIIKQNKESIAEYHQEIETAEQDAAQAKEKMVLAKKGDDLEAYAKAVAEQRTANDIVGFYAGKLEKLKAEPLITRDEYRECTRRIKSEMDNINKRASNRLSEIMAELEEIQNELNPAHVKTNELLSNLQNNIYKHSAEKQMKEARENKVAINSNELKNEYKDNSVIVDIDYILNSHIAKNIKERGDK